MSKELKVNILSLGSDPEFLIIDKNTGKYVSSLGIIPGEKSEPVNLEELGKGYSIQKDNVLAELCVPPAKDGDELFNNILKAINYVNNNILPPHLQLATVTGGYFTPEDLDNDYAREFGCSPSFNAWQWCQNNPGDNVSDYRGAGCHIHIGYENPSMMTNVELIRAFDLFAGVPNLMFEPDRIRRKQYGQAGEFRETRYGVEARILGGSLLSNKLFFDTAIKGLYLAADFVNNNGEFSDEQQLKIQACINDNDTDLAKELIEEFQLEHLIESVLVSA